MRILVIQRPTVSCIDGMRLDRFVPGHQYEVGAALATLFLAERWAEPVSGAPPALAIAPNEFDTDPATSPAPPVRENDPPHYDDHAAFAAAGRRRDGSKRRAI